MIVPAEVPDVRFDFLAVEDLHLAIRKFSFTVLSFLPGLALGPFVAIGWWIAATLFVLRNRTDLLLELFMLWNFTFQGAYQYHLLGADLAHPLIRYFNSFLTLAILFILVLGPRRKDPQWGRILTYSVVFMAVALLSGFANAVPLFGLLQYFIIYFRWLVIAVVFAKCDVPTSSLKRMITLLLVIVAANSVFASLQQTVLPVQVTPDGYVPDYFDLAAGLLGVISTQFLTVICLMLASFYILRFLSGTGRHNILILMCLLVQPFISSSKAALFICGANIVLATFVFYFFLTPGQKMRFSMVRIGTLFLLSYLGIELYNMTNAQEFGGITDPVKARLENFVSLDELKKVQGYVIAVTQVAPNGALGTWFGVGPGNFLLADRAASPAAFGDMVIGGEEAARMSSADQQNTDMAAFIGELGLVGAFAFVLMASVMIFESYRRARLGTSTEGRIFSLFAASFILTILLYSVYDKGWLSAFYYMPIYLLTAYDINLTSEDHSTAKATLQSVASKR